MGILYIPFSGITSLFRENAHPISGKYIPNTGILYIPLSGIISLFWEVYPKYGNFIYPTFGNHIPFLGKNHIPFSGTISQKREK